MVPPARRATRSAPGNDLPELEIWFPGPGGEPIEVVDPPSTEEALRQAYGVVTTAFDQLKHQRAAPGPRPGGDGDRPQRRGLAGEIFTPVLVDPALAARVATDGTLFTPPVPGLTFSSPDPPHPGRQRLTWPVLVTTGLGRRHAILRIGSSPSANLTVLELVPARRDRFRAPAFVRAGIMVTQELADRLLSTAQREDGGGSATTGSPSPRDPRAPVDPRW